MRPAPARRRRGSGRRRAAGAVGIVGAALCLSACANHDALGLARQACAHVDGALSLYARAQTEGTSPQAATDDAASLSELRAALPIASVAAGQSPRWQALMTTLSESARVPEAYLVHALDAQCASVRSAGL
jgi:hypothetical protein